MSFEILKYYLISAYNWDLVSIEKKINPLDPHICGVSIENVTNFCISDDLGPKSSKKAKKLKREEISRTKVMREEAKLSQIFMQQFQAAILCNRHRWSGPKWVVHSNKIWFFFSIQTSM